MKIILILIAAFSVLGLVTFNAKKVDIGSEPEPAVASAQPEAEPSSAKPPVLVELFTSEGCSSCPPADRNLITLDKEQAASQVEVITLSMHVDYWNRLGWTDVFSSRQYSERQGSYSERFKLDGVYTPQMVVDGQTEFVGGRLGEAEKAVEAAAKTPKGNVELSASDNKLSVKISGLPDHSPASVFVAVAENDLSTAVRNGENGGKTLRHTSVVRELKMIGEVPALKDSFAAEVPLQIQPSWKKQNLKVVVFAQVEQTGKIIGVSQIKL
ncbi:MAG: DUF1223 domain-containing protein [Acidobacteriota bacterium]